LDGNPEFITGPHPGQLLFSEFSSGQRRLPGSSPRSACPRDGALCLLPEPHLFPRRRCGLPSGSQKISLPSLSTPRAGLCCRVLFLDLTNTSSSLKKPMNSRIIKGIPTSSVFQPGLRNGPSMVSPRIHGPGRGDEPAPITPQYRRLSRPRLIRIGQFCLVRT